MNNKKKKKEKKKKTYGPNDVVVVWAAWARCFVVLGAGGRGEAGSSSLSMEGGRERGREGVAASASLMVVGGQVMGALAAAVRFVMHSRANSGT
jgi:hypothetical protein